MKKNLIILTMGLLILFVASLAFTEPGSDSDPLVTLSYLEKRIDQVRNYIDQKSSGSPGKTQDSWTVVEVQGGEFLIGGSGTEIILRAGEAKALSIVVGHIENGLTDITSGRDLGANEDIVQNHLLIIPRADGRGAYSVNHTYWLVKGDYEIR